MPRLAGTKEYGPWEYGNMGTLGRTVTTWIDGPLGSMPVVDWQDKGDEMSNPSNGAVVLHSGGQDSTTCLLMAIDKHGVENVYPVTFRYEQKHEVEVGQARLICEILGVRPPMILNIPALKQLGGGALTNNDIPTIADAAGTQNKYAEEHYLPPTVVPGRNVVFLALAAGYGAKFGIYELWTGGCQADYEGYPDCRPLFYAAMQQALVNALDDSRVDIVTPLTDKSKGETFRIADDLGYLDLIVNHTHTCYNGDRVHMHEWGTGCGDCPACETRELGWHEYINSLQDSDVRR